VKHRIVALSEDNLIDAPEWDADPFSCKWCLYWEDPELPGGRTEDRDEAFRRKLDWLKRVEREFEAPGKLLYVEGSPVGYAAYAPGRFFPNASAYPAGPVSDDAAFIGCLFIASRENRGRGLGSLLLEATITDLRERGTPAVETFARRGSAENPSGPVELYLKHSFSILRDDPQFPLMRLDLR